MSYSEFKQKIKMQAYYVGQKTLRVGSGSKVTRMDKIDLLKMREQGIDFPI